jgi:hypothetical protein
MNTYRTLAAAAVLVAATFVAASSFTQDSGQTRTPPRPAPAQGAQSAQPAQPRPAQPAQPSRPPQTSQPSRRPPQPTPPQHAVPRPPRPPQTTRPPVRSQVHPSYIYPYWPLFDLDFVYQFPYGAYPYYRYGYPYPPYYYPAPAPGYESDVVAEEVEGGSVRVDIPQKSATIYVDGFYVGVVEDFDGETEPLNLAPGPHHLEIRAPGYQTAAFDVNIQSGKTITYRAALQPES